MLSFSNSFEFVCFFEYKRCQFFVKRFKTLKSSWNEQRFRNHSVNFGIVSEKCEVFEDDTLSSLPECVKNSDDHFCSFALSALAFG